MAGVCNDNSRRLINVGPGRGDECRRIIESDGVDCLSIRALSPDALRRALECVSARCKPVDLCVALSVPACAFDECERVLVEFVRDDDALETLSLARGWRPVRGTDFEKRLKLAVKTHRRLWMLACEDWTSDLHMDKDQHRAVAHRIRVKSAAKRSGQ